ASLIDLSDGTFLLMADGALCAGCFAAGFTAAKRRGRQGMKTGLVCGIIIFSAVLLGGLIFVRSFSAGGFFTKLLIILICSSIGGIFGVNSPRRFR
ncbi:MAG: TIGR04086 family membrane protein, partial [Oscillospiraceae bacterium]|nr:TIGR04086 family membrane protein [Oscillospiraceae bacterium]